MMGADQDEGFKKLKNKRYNGLLEWVLDQEGHEFLCEIDRSYLKDKSNLIGIREKLKNELSLKEDAMDD